MPGQSAIVIGAGIAGIATAYYLTRRPIVSKVILIDRYFPMTLTSAQSGENYRNWWPHPVMTEFTDLSITLMEELARASGNRFNMTRRGYALATRQTEIPDLIDELRRGYSSSGSDALRLHSVGASSNYRPPGPPDWDSAPDGVDIIQDNALLRTVFPSFDPAISTVVHIRRAGDIDGQQLGQLMLEKAREAGLDSVRGTVRSACAQDGTFSVEIETNGGTIRLGSDLVFNAAGPFAGYVGRMLGYELPVKNVLQQKIAFPDRNGAIPRNMPFAIDLDSQSIDWDPQDAELLLEDEEQAWLARTLQGGVHCKPDLAERGEWVKLGWAIGRDSSEPAWEPTLDDWFPEVVLRGAARLNPGLRSYLGRLPRQRIHYGGYYTMTRENWPLIGPAGKEGSFVVGALSGFGTMAACGAGWLAAAAATGAELPGFAGLLGPSRYSDREFVAGLEKISHRSLL